MSYPTEPQTEPLRLGPQAQPPRVARTIYRFAGLIIVGWVVITVAAFLFVPSLEKVEKDIAVIEARLGNAGFVAKAPEEVLEETRERKTALAAQRGKLKEALKRLK